MEACDLYRDLLKQHICHPNTMQMMLNGICMEIEQVEKRMDEMETRMSTVDKGQPS